MLSSLNVSALDICVPPRNATTLPTVRITPEAQEQVDGLPKAISPRVLKLVERLAKWPTVSGVKALSGDLAGWYRVRTGDYRLRFRVTHGEVVIDKVGHRRDFYDE